MTYSISTRTNINVWLRLAQRIEDVSDVKWNSSSKPTKFEDEDMISITLTDGNTLVYDLHQDDIKGKIVTWNEFVKQCHIRRPKKE